MILAIAIGVASAMGMLCVSGLDALCLILVATSSAAYLLAAFYRPEILNDSRAQAAYIFERCGDVGLLGLLYVLSLDSVDATFAAFSGRMLSALSIPTFVFFIMALALLCPITKTEGSTLDGLRVEQEHRSYQLLLIYLMIKIGVTLLLLTRFAASWQELQNFLPLFFLAASWVAALSLWDRVQSNPIRYFVSSQWALMVVGCFMVDRFLLLRYGLCFALWLGVASHQAQIRNRLQQHLSQTSLSGNLNLSLWRANPFALGVFALFSLGLLAFPLGVGFTFWTQLLKAAYDQSVLIWLSLAALSIVHVVVLMQVFVELWCPEENPLQGGRGLSLSDSAHEPTGLRLLFMCLVVVFMVLSFLPEVTEQLLLSVMQTPLGVGGVLQSATSESATRLPYVELGSLSIFDVSLVFAHLIALVACWFVHEQSHLLETRMWRAAANDELVGGYWRVVAVPLASLKRAGQDFYEFWSQCVEQGILCFGFSVLCQIWLLMAGILSFRLSGRLHSYLWSLALGISMLIYIVAG